MHILCFVEEPSAEAALVNLLPKILPTTTFQFIVFQGKLDLLKNLLPRLRGYAGWLPWDYRIVVLIDEDREVCFQLKNTIEDAATEADFVTKSRAGYNQFQVLNRIAVEELEAWFLGDVEALRAAFPRIPISLTSRKKFRDPDKVPGGTWESLEKLLQSLGYFPAGYPKVQAAQQISEHMDPARNRSHSFQVFYQGLCAL
jgi:hypothetical protein